MGKAVTPLTSADVETEVNRLQILAALEDNEPIGLADLRQETGLSTENSRAAMRPLEESGLVTPSKHGARLTNEGHALLDDLEMELEERIEGLENGDLTLESGTQPRSSAIEGGQSESTAEPTIVDRIRNLF